MSPEVRVTESHFNGVEVLIVLGGADVDWVLRRPEVPVRGAVDGDVGARVVEDPTKPERERADVTSTARTIMLRGCLLSFVLN